MDAAGAATVEAPSATAKAATAVAAKVKAEAGSNTGNGSNGSSGGIADGGGEGELSEYGCSYAYAYGDPYDDALAASNGKDLAAAETLTAHAGSRAGRSECKGNEQDRHGVHSESRFYPPDNAEGFQISHCSLSMD